MINAMAAWKAAVVVGVLMLAMASPAGAEELGTSHGFTYASGTASIPGGGTATSAQARAECPQGTRAIGGGGQMAVGTSGSLASSNLDGSDWFTDAWHSAPGAEELTTFAVCAKKSNKIHPRTNTRHEPAGFEGTATVVRCRAGRITGGGAEVLGDPTEWIVDRSFPSAGQDADSGGADAWTAFASHSNTDASTIKATVVCMRGIDSVRAKTRVGRDTPGPVTKVVGCPDGTVVTGGGYISYGATGVATITGSVPVDTARDADSIPDDAWRLDAVDSLGGTKFQVRAVCV